MYNVTMRVMANFIVHVNLIITELMFVFINSCRSKWPRGQRRRSAAAWFLELRVRIPQVHGCLSVVIVVCCQVEVSASNWSLVQMIPNKCDRESSIMRNPWSTSGSFCMGKKHVNQLINHGNKENYRQYWNVDNQDNHGEVSKQSTFRFT
jgi:hypothetical protein